MSIRILERACSTPVLLVLMDGDKTTTEISAATGCPSGTITRALKHLIEEKLVEYKFEGDYPPTRKHTLTSSGQQIAGLLSRIKEILESKKK